jgi:adenylate cyclase
MATMESPSGGTSQQTHYATRRTAAVVFGDVVGYTRLMQVDEDDTHRRMMRLRADIIEPYLKAHRGRLIKHTGDGFMATFEGAAEAAECVIELQRALVAAGIGESLSSRISFRMAVNLAELLFTENDVFGDGVNVAARLLNYAEPGGIVVSESIVKQIGRRPEMELADLGHLPLRGTAFLRVP